MPLTVPPEDAGFIETAAMAWMDFPKKVEIANLGASPVLARFGRRGYVSGHPVRLSLQDVNVTPNHQAMAARWSFPRADRSCGWKTWAARQEYVACMCSTRPRSA